MREEYYERYSNDFMNTDAFIKRLAPYPFTRNGSKKVYVKILQSSTVDESVYEQANFHLSIINENMLDIDYSFFTGEGDFLRLENYRPYFYEFYAQVSDVHQIRFLINRVGQWLQAEFMENERNLNNTEGIIVSGIVFFSASPFTTMGMMLYISDKSAPDAVVNKVKRSYETNSAKVRCNDKKHIDLTNQLNAITNCGDFCIKIYNVCQGNGIYIYTNGGYRILFDIGFNKDPHASDWNSVQKNQIAFIYSKIRPDIVILSHWDMDHIIGVCFANDKIFDVEWIAPDLNELPEKQVSISACRLAKYLHWRGVLSLIDDSFLNKNVFSNNISGFEIWRGKGKSHCLTKANNFGLIIRINTCHPVLLPGDCEYDMLPDLLALSKIRYSYLVVPHHCSEMNLPLTYLPKKSADDINYAIISVGDNGYTPKHPVKSHKDFLTNTLKYIVLQTPDCKYYIHICSTHIVGCSMY